jgi:acylphosphatase
VVAVADDGITARRVRVSGRVQGVGFRYGMQRQAEQRGVAGWARNCPDGTVEAMLEGDPDAIERVIDWCRRGPGGARVSDVSVMPAEARGARGFDVR